MEDGNETEKARVAPKKSRRRSFDALKIRRALAEELAETGTSLPAFLLLEPAEKTARIALALALLSHRRRWLIPPLNVTTGVLYTIPSIAFFFLLLPITGRGDVTAVIALTAYTLQILYRNIVAGLANVPADTKDAGRGMGMSQRQLLWRVELPLALPEIIAGLRIATVSTVALATLAVFAGGGGLGSELIAGSNITFKTGVIIAGGMAILIAVTFDLLLVLAQKLLAPVADGAARMTDALVFADVFSSFGDAFEFITAPQESAFAGSEVGGPEEVLDKLIAHLRVSAAAFAAAVAIALPVGVWLGHRGRGEGVAIALGNAGRAVPELALIAFLVAFVGVGFLNVTIALAVLGIPPILTNAFVGIRQVDRSAVEAARGMGMTDLEVVRKIELPLAVPTIFTGLRTSAINIIATATIATLAGVTTLGDFIINRNVFGDAGVLAGAILVATLAITVELVLAGIQRLLTPQGIRLQRADRIRIGFRQRLPRHRMARSLRTQRRTVRMREHPRLRALLAIVAALVLALGLAACGDDDDEESGDGETTATAIEANPDNEGIELTVGSKNFDEQFILGEIYAQALEAAGYTISKDLNLGSEQVALKALQEGEIDAYPEYTSTALTSFFDFAPEDASGDVEQVYEDAQAEFEQEGLVAFPPTSFTSANAVGLLTETAEELGVASISDLEGASEDLTLAGSPECRERVDCLKGLEDNYGLSFAEFTPVDIELRYEVLDKGDADLSILFTTDGQLAESEDYTLLEDDQELLPAGNVLFVASQEAVDEAGPDMQETVEKVQEGLTLEVMQELNARVSLDREKPEDVAADYLQQAGYVE